MKVLCLLIAFVSTSIAAFLPYREKHQQIISHRGASGYLPEHSLQAYQLAINLGTDYVEPDLCLTKDGIFVAMHDILLDDTTDVASHPEFTDKKTTKVVDGVKTTGYFVSDFLLEEIQTLRVKQRVSSRPTIYNGYFLIPTFSQIMTMLQTQYNQTSYMIGMYPELKHPAFHHSLGFEMEDMFLQSLVDGGYAINGEFVYRNLLSTVVPVIVQCFESTSLEYIHSKSSLPLMLLVKPTADMTGYLSDAFIDKAAEYVSALGPEKLYFYPENIKRAKHVVEKTHNLGLALHPWTFRADDTLAAPFTGNFAAEENYFYGCLGIDAVFTEFPDLTREAIDNLRKSNDRGTTTVVCPMVVV